MRKLGIALALLVTLLFAGTLYYFMPRATKVLVTGTEVKRMDRKDAKTGEDQTRDVRFIYAKDVETNEARVFRNEDNGWYFKFNAGDIAAEASKLANNDVAETALLRYYGLRVAVFDLYPNVLSLKEVAPDYVYVPWGNMVILILFLVFFLWAGVKVRHLFRKGKGTKRPPAS